uniref:Uncharacterized protein n=1 Tax=Mesocestoides corti TaxID=53468 RepID=A0A5K3FWJ9_MESCO
MRSQNSSRGSLKSVGVHRIVPNNPTLPSSLVKTFPAWMLQRQCASPTLDISSNRIYLLH